MYEKMLRDSVGKTSPFIRDKLRISTTSAASSANSSCWTSVTSSTASTTESSAKAVTSRSSCASRRRRDTKRRSAAEENKGRQIKAPPGTARSRGPYREELFYPDKAYFMPKNAAMRTMTAAIFALSRKRWSAPSTASNSITFSSAKALTASKGTISSRVPCRIRRSSA